MKKRQDSKLFDLDDRGNLTISWDSPKCSQISLPGTEEDIDEIGEYDDEPTADKYFAPYDMARVYNGEGKALFKVVSLFAGGGGSSTGYRLAGGQVLLVNEFVEAARDTYSANYPKTIVLSDDIRQLMANDILDKIGMKQGELDILDGSPPCASFSMSGKREKGWGKKKKYSDTEQRTDDLFFEYARLLKEIQPKVFIAENVKGLTIGIAKKLLGSQQMALMEVFDSETIFKTLTGCGYNVRAKVLDASRHGAPQKRERLFLIGVRNDIEREPVFPRQLPKLVTLGEAWVGLAQNEEQRVEISEEAKRHEKSWYGWLTKIPKDPDRCISASSVHPRGSYFNLIRCSLRTPAPTITQMVSFSSPCHPLEDRRLTIPEVKRVFSLPDDFILTGTYEQQYERCGRMVPAFLMKAVAENVYRQILSKGR